MSPNKQTRATRGPCHRLSMLKRHRWPFRHRAAKSELPVPYRLLSDTSPFPFTSQLARRKQSHRNLSQKKLDLHPLNQESLFWGSIWKNTPAIYIYTMGPQNLHVCKQPGFPFSPAASHQTALTWLSPKPLPFAVAELGTSWPHQKTTGEKKSSVKSVTPTKMKWTKTSCQNQEMEANILIRSSFEFLMEDSVDWKVHVVRKWVSSSYYGEILMGILLVE